MSFEYPIDKMELPELELIFTVVKGIRTKYRSQANRFITFGIWPKIEGVSHNDLIHIIGRLSNAGYIKRRTGISMLIGLSIEITDSFEPFYNWVEATIELRRIELEEAGDYISDEPLIYDSFNPETKILLIGDLNPIEISAPKMYAIMQYIFNENKDDLTQDFFYSEICDYIAGEEKSYNSKIKDAHAPYSKACDRINNKIKDKTEGLVDDFLKPSYSNRGSVTVNQKYL